jgi:hypothetical protein
MTNSTAKVQAASNGDAISTDSKRVPAQRVHGINRLREEECYYITALVRQCLDEAEHLVRKAHDKCYSRVLDHDGSKGTQPLDHVEMMLILDEAYECTVLALTYIFSTSTHLRDHDQPAF